MFQLLYVFDVTTDQNSIVDCVWVPIVLVLYLIVLKVIVQYLNSYLNEKFILYNKNNENSINDYNISNNDNNQIVELTEVKCALYNQNE